jgi:PilZ domain
MRWALLPLLRRVLGLSGDVRHHLNAPGTPPMTLFPLFALTFDGYWVVPLVGGVGFIAAVLLGRRLIAPRPAEAPADVPLENFLGGVTQDRRALPRRKGNTVEVQLSDGSERPPVNGCVIDRSQGGLRVLVDEPFAEGTVLKIRPTGGGVTTPWTDATIRSCRRDGIQYELGLRFDQMPNWNQLLQFG